jgi:hypothetical protein
MAVDHGAGLVGCEQSSRKNDDHQAAEDLSV